MEVLTDSFVSIEAPSTTWPGFEADGGYVHTPTDELEGPLLSAMEELEIERVRASRLEAVLQVERALAGLSNSGRPARAATAIQMALRRHFTARRFRALPDGLKDEFEAAQRIQAASRHYLNEVLPQRSRTALRRELVREREAVRKKELALERLIGMQVDAIESARKARKGEATPTADEHRQHALDMATLGMQLDEKTRQLHSLAEELTRCRMEKEAAEDTASRLLAEKLTCEEQGTAALQRGSRPSSQSSHGPRLDNLVIGVRDSNSSASSTKSSAAGTFASARASASAGGSASAQASASAGVAGRNPMRPIDLARALCRDERRSPWYQQ
jgi:hypothetical protein